MNLNRIILEDIFLCDPISKRGKTALKRISQENDFKKMTVESFYDEIYVQPYFVDLVKSAKEIEKEYSDYENFIFSHRGLNAQSLYDKKERYETKFLSPNSDHIMFIRASAGSGKSIYLNKLKLERRAIISKALNDGSANDDFEENFDLEISKSIFQYGKISFPSHEYSIISDNIMDIDSPWHFFNMIMERLTKKCRYFIDQRDKFDNDVLWFNFKKIYGYDYQESIKLLYTLLIDGKPFIEDENELRTYLFKNIIDICFVNKSSVSRCIVKSLETLTRLLTIYSDIDNPRQVLISFDNIEHFINSKKRIFDEDISKITLAVTDFAEDEYQHYEEVNLNFAKFFKIILVVRDTTSKMFSNDVHTIFNRVDCSIDVTGWFSLEKIYNQKLMYYSKFEEKSIAIRFFKLIIEDSMIKTKNNLMEQISTMYNHNNRRTTRMLSHIAFVFENYANNGVDSRSILNYDQYCTLWGWHTKNHVKYLCRQSIMRLIFNEISSTNYFASICNNIEKCTTTQNTYALRILSWLANKNSHIDESYYSYYRIVKEILCNPSIEVGNVLSDNEFIQFSKVLIALDEHRFETTTNFDTDTSICAPNYWCQLIIINHHELQLDSILNPHTLAKKIRNNFERQIDDDYNYGIRLTEAGYFFANALCDYEYFACQYAKKDFPLVFMTDYSSIVETIKSVYNASKKYINNALLFEYQHFNNHFYSSYEHLYHLRHISNNNNFEFQSIPYRICNQHITYLKAYKLYIEDDELHQEAKLFNDSIRKSIINVINEYIKLYKKLCFDIEKGEYKITIKKDSYEQQINIKDYILSVADKNN